MNEETLVYIKVCDDIVNDPDRPNEFPEMGEGVDKFDVYRHLLNTYSIVPRKSRIGNEVRLGI